MKILMLISSLGVGGAETHVCELSAALVRLGDSVCVVSDGGALANSLSEAGVEHIRLKVGSRNPASLVRAYIGLRRLLRRRHFDVVHAHSRIAAYVGEMAARGSGVCFVTTAHAEFSTAPLKKYMSKWGYYVSAVSEDIARYLRRVYGIGRDRIRVIPNGIDTEKFCLRADSGKNNKKILFASRLDSDCSAGACSLLRIAPRLAEKYPDVRILIAGGGREYERLCRISREVNERVGYEFVDMLGARSDINEIMKDCGIFVGVSRAALEAMACGARVALCGNEGFLGVLDENNISDAEKSNFCARGYPAVTDSRLCYEVERLLDMSDEESVKLSDFLRGYILKNHSIDGAALQTRRFYREAARGRCIGRGDVCICGYYGYGNMGDDALLSGAIRRARDEYGDGICAIVCRPRSSGYRYGVHCVSPKNPFSVWREIGSARCLVFGGGTLFQDRTSLRSLLYYAAIAEAARIRGVRIELWGNGLGPIGSALGRRIAGRVLRSCAYLGFRDRRSAELALSLGADENAISLEDDLTFYLKEKERSEGILVPHGRYAVFAVSGKGSKRELAVVQHRADELGKLGVRRIFVGMYPAEDRRISERIAEAVGGEYIERLDGGELVALLRGAELCCGMRLHSLIFSNIAETPFEGVGSDPKIKAFCEEHGGIYTEV